MNTVTGITIPDNIHNNKKRGRFSPLFLISYINFIFFHFIIRTPAPPFGGTNIIDDNQARFGSDHHL